MESSNSTIVSQKDEETEVLPKKRRSAFAPGRKSLIEGVDEDESSSDSNEEETREKLTLLYQVISEHKKEQADWLSLMDAEKRLTDEKVTSEEDNVVIFKKDDEPEGLPVKYYKAILKSKNFRREHWAALETTRAELADLKKNVENDLILFEDIVDRYGNYVDQQCAEAAHRLAGAYDAVADVLTVQNDSGINIDSNIDPECPA